MGKHQGLVDVLKPQDNPTSYGCEEQTTLARPKDNSTPGLGDSAGSQCRSCMYYLNARCRRHAPKGQEGWPAVYGTDYCGDHKIAKKNM